MKGSFENFNKDSTAKENKLEPVEGSDIGYGSSLEIKRDEVDIDNRVENSSLRLREASSADEDYPKYERYDAEGNPVSELSEKQRGDLRTILRSVIGGGALAFATSQYGSDKLSEQEVVDNLEPETTATQTHVSSSDNRTFSEVLSGEPDFTLNEALSGQSESNEVIENVDTFTAAVSGYKASVLLSHNEVQFVDEFNRPVGELVKYDEFDAPKAGKEGLYKYTPGKIDKETGILQGDLAGEWLDYKKQEIEEQNIGQKIANTMHVEEDFQKALVEDDEPELVAKIKNGEITKYIDIVKYFGDKPVVGAEDYSRLEYVRTLKFTNDVPELVQSELKRLMTGLCAQESKFNAGLTSPAGAEAIFQFKPKTWLPYNDNLEDITSLVAQTEVAGKHFSDLYKWIQAESLVGEGTIDTLKSKFESEEDFQRDLLVPLIINAHNTGIGTMSGVLKDYVESHDVEEIPEGKELYMEIIEYGHKTDSNESLAAYGDEAFEYTARVYAQTEVLDQTEGSPMLAQSDQ